MTSCALILGISCAIAPTAESTPSTGGDVRSRRVPIIYGTDLFHPHDDPDDHFDLATLFAIEEFEVRAILLDLGDRQRAKPGRIPLEQMFTLTGRRIPFATGLSHELKSPDDKALDQPRADQEAITLLMKTLDESPEPLVVFTAGSVRDVCAAFNRDPGLCRRKISRLYINIGSTSAETEWNVGLDPHAYIGLMRSGLPIYWCPCLPFDDPGSTQWAFRHSDVLSNCAPALQSFFIYALQQVQPGEIDPIAAMRSDLRPWRHLVFAMPRRMWCTGPFFHAAGRDVFALPDGYVASAAAPPQGMPSPVFEFAPARVTVADNARTTTDFDAAHPNIHVFRQTRPDEYGKAMTDCLRRLLKRFPLAHEKPPASQE